MKISHGALTTMVVAILALTACTPNSGLSSDQSNSQTNVSTQTKNNTAQAKNNIYTSKEHHFTLEYPSSWHTIQREGVIITANDQDNSWGGTNLNLQYDFQAGDVTMGWKEIKKSEKYTNPQGLKFTLSFYSQDENFNKENDVKIDLNEVHILINTDAIPGLKLFSYNKTVNPNGEKQLRDILATVKENQ